MIPLLAPLHVAVSALIVLWDIWLAGHISQQRRLPRPFAAVTALAGLLIAPALLVVAATSNMLYGRSLGTIAWLWPAVTILFAVQAVYALARHYVRRRLGIPIAVYDALVALAATTRYLVAQGHQPPAWMLTVLAAQESALVFVSPVALVSPYYLLMPVIAPAFAARWRASGAVRYFVAWGIAGVWAAVITSELLRGGAAVQSYRIYDTARLTERPAGDLAVGVKLFPDLGGPPPPVALTNDLALVDSVGADVIGVVIDPAGVTNATLDSLAHTLDALRRDSVLLVVTLGNPVPSLSLHPRQTFDAQRRLRAVDRIARRLRPDILLPVDEPYGRASRAFGTLGLAAWQDYLTRATTAAHRVNRRIRIGVAVGSYGRRDSALYAWAAGEGAPVDVVGFNLIPSRRGALGLEAELGTAARWMRAARSTKDHWVFSAAGLPLDHGERNQERALLGALAWATSHPEVRGFIATEPGDYGTSIGLRAADRRLRRAAHMLAASLRALQESAAAAGQTPP